MPTTTRTTMVPDSGRSTEAGFSMLFLIGVILALSTLAAGMASMSTSSVYNELNALSFAQARAVALSGYTYVQQFKEDYDELEGETIELTDDSEFSIGDNMRQRQDSNGNLWMNVEIIGTVHKGTSSEANYVLDRSFQPEDQGAITFADNWEDFKEITPDNNTTPITKNQDKTFTIGNGQKYAFGAFYYMGSKKLNWGDNWCTYGECQFKRGFRLFFVSDYSKSDADGIVFTWFNSQTDVSSRHGDDCLEYYDAFNSGVACGSFATANNPIYVSKYKACIDNDDTTDCGLFASVGGDSQHGELIGYAGDGRYYLNYNYGTLRGWLDPEQNGIQPPKMGIEFDNFYNSASGICNKGVVAPPQTGTRNDPGSSGNATHVAYVFWGMRDVDIETYNNSVQSDTDEYLLCGAYDAMTETNTCLKSENVWTCNPWGYNCKWKEQCVRYKYDFSYYTVGSPTNGLSGGSSSLAGSYTYDDNRHGVGTTPAKDNPNALKYYGGSWVGKPFAFRAEVERSLVKNGKEKYVYDYEITSWLTYCSKSTDCGEYWDDADYDNDNGQDGYYDDLYFSDTSRFLCHETAKDGCSNGNTPTLHYKISLTQEEHEMFDTMMFGFTEATGGSTQTATYSQFILQFIKDNDYNYNADGYTIKNRRRIHDRKITLNKN